MTDDELKNLTDKIIAAVAKRNHQIVRPDDPVMILPTMMQLIVDQLHEKQKQELLEFRAHLHQVGDTMMKIMTEAVKDSTKMTLDSTKDTITSHVQSAAESGSVMMRDAVRGEVEKSFTAYRAEYSDLKNRTETLGLAAKFAFCGGIIAFLGGISAIVATVIR